MTPRSPEQADAPTPATRFGVRLGGVAVALPAGTPLEFVAGAVIYPLPLAPARVAGLMPLRGQPLLVLDPSKVPEAAAAIRRRDVLVVGQPPQAAALLVDAAPQPLEDGSWHRAGTAPPDCAFASAIRFVDPGSASGRAPGEAWHEVDPAGLLESLARS
ncbi:MAG: chemotaxis protein CheW [Burkholderiaceae bacterium]|nr:chemotaxis protein CheW [Burkholderiaceae bacterium]